MRRIASLCRSVRPVLYRIVVPYLSIAEHHGPFRKLRYVRLVRYQHNC